MVETPLCPITQEPIDDPVVAPDGHTYERSAIEEWIQHNGTSPQTRQPLRVEDLVPNRALRSMITDQKQNDSSKTVKEQSPREILALASPEEVHARLSETVEASARKSSATEDHIVLRIEVPDASECTSPNHICCVIDVSGSMQLEAPCKDETGEETSTGLSVLDVVKFATLVISRSLGPNDRLSIVTFSQTARTVLSPTPMNEAGKKLARDALASMSVEGMTNLWAGIAEGVKLASRLGSDFNSSVFVLTDGMPNCDPPLGYERSLTRLLSQHPIFGTISTFGFGYSLDSPLLNDLSRLGGGYFSFIPDAGFVGTCFINAVANARCAFGAAPRVVIHKDIMDTDKDDITADGQLHVVRPEQEENAPKTTCIELTPFRYGQSVDVVLNSKFVDLGDRMEVEFFTIMGQRVSVPVKAHSDNPSLQAEDKFHFVRTRFVKDVHAVLKQQRPRHGADWQTARFVPAQEAEALPGSGDKKLNALVQDIEGQATEAVSTREWFDRWGRHYLFSLSGAHLHQFCNNFKDPGVQLYGAGRLFSSLQEELNDIFEAVPPPRATARRSRPGPALASMTRTFNNRNVVCVHGDTDVRVLEDESGASSLLPISRLSCGDRVATADGTFAKVKCVVQTIVDKTEPLALVRLGKLLITPYHPVISGGDWTFPIDVVRGELVETKDCDSVYNLVLEEGDRPRAVLMDGIPCVTLGHRIKGGGVVPHAFFGTDSILDDLAANYPRGWREGRIVLRERDVRRDGVDGTIVGIAPSNPAFAAVCVGSAS